ncbi:MAG TPA: DUF3501 family protein [Gammaproteobacteria bacterium]|nr:DUF3501 family protein [Gammaproteobacteria bacterium]
MDKLTTEDLLSLERYHKERPRLRAEVLAHKRHRQAPLGPHLTLYFEDRITMRYQIQEMLRAERIFESEAIAEELEAYNPLIPDGSNLKATMMLEYPDVEQRRRALEQLKGIENAVYLEVGTLGRVFAYADEDLERSDDTKTSAVHFLRFELDAGMCSALKSGAPLTIGVDHESYRHELASAPEVRQSLAADLD